MASTYSPSLRIELIGAGEQAGTWNTTTNTNLGTLIESAIAGYVAVSVTSANQALTAENGAADQSRNAVIALTTTTGANFAVYAPPQEKTYVIYNTSAYVATIYNSTVQGNTTAAGAGVAVAAGAKVQVFSDGTNFRSVDAGSFTSSTGTGSVVLNTTPSINNINMGYTSTATAAGTTTLTVASNYQQRFTGTTTQTIVLPVTSTLVAGISYLIENKSTGNLTVNSSGSNLVVTVIPGVTVQCTCIGTTLTTAADWDVEYDAFAKITGAGAVALVGLTSTATAAGTTTLTATSNSHQRFTGTTTQTIVLPVTSTLIVGTTYTIENASTGNLTVNSSGANLVITIIPGVTVTCTCIGTTLTTAADWDAEYDRFATVTGTGAAVLATSPTMVTPTLGAASATSVALGAGAVSTPSLTATGDTNTGIFFPAADVIAVTIGGAEAARFITNTIAPALLMGTTTLVTGLIGRGTFVYDSASEQGVVIKSSSTTFTGNPVVFVNNANGVSGQIAQTQTTVSYNTSSDYRLKNSIAPMTGALDKVALLKPCTYKWNYDNSDSQGFIAHELQAVVKECVTGEKDALNEDGSIKTQGVDTSFLVATLTAAIQELKALVDAQAARINALESR